MMKYLTTLLMPCLRYALITVILLPLLSFTTGCQSNKHNGNSPSYSEGDTPLLQSIYYGTRAPQNTFLTEGEQLAIGYLADPGGRPFCTGTLIAPRLVISANHCVDSTTPPFLFFGIGVDPHRPKAFLPTIKIIRHPATDFVLLILGVNAVTALPSITPIAMNRDAVNSAWMGRWVDASGFGQTDDNSDGRYFGSVQIDSFDTEIVRVNGHGEQGICFGDSGGPILWQPDADTAPVVVGTEQYGDPSCVDFDVLTRVDLVANWVDTQIAEGLPATLETCLEDNYDGLCAADGSHVSWCSRGFLHLNQCINGCGYLGNQVGYTCIPESCANVDYFGSCAGTVLTFCSVDGLVQRNCASRGGQCIFEDTATGYNCGECQMCDGVCANYGNDVNNCGGCDVSCTPAHATPACLLGDCIIESCDEGYEDQDGDLVNGCEINLKPKKHNTSNNKFGCAASGTRPLWMMLISIVMAVLMYRRSKRAKDPFAKEKIKPKINKK